jgi:cell division septation protein DedD
MMEHIADEQLSLYAAGDLAAAERQLVAVHVEACSDCRNTVAEFREMHRFVSESLSDPETEDLLQVREGVAEKLQRRQSGLRRWPWGLAAVAAMLAFLIATLRFESHPAMAPEPVPTIAHLTPPEQAPLRPAEPAPVHTVRHVRHRDAGIRSVALITRANEPPVIKMTTADPNVVILWQSNQTEDE